MMSNYVFFIVIMTLSFSVLADHHKGPGKSGPGEKLFKMADSDNDGQVSYDEHEVFIAMQADKGRERFNKMDSDGNGYVTKKEAKEESKAMRKKMMQKKKGMREKRKAMMEEEKLNEEKQFLPFVNKQKGRLIKRPFCSCVHHKSQSQYILPTKQLNNTLNTGVLCLIT